MTAAPLSDGRHEAAEVSDGRQTAARYSVPAAAQTLGIPIRTLRDWIQAGKVRTRDPIPPQRGRQIPADELERLRRAAAAEVCEGRHPEADGGGSVRPAAEGCEGRRQEAAADGGTVELHVLRAELAAVRHERETMAETIDHLRAQLDLRAHEIQQERTAGEQLRVMLLKLEATNAELAGALAPKALPPAPEEKPRVRWWALWGR